MQTEIKQVKIQERFLRGRQQLTAQKIAAEHFLKTREVDNA